MRKGRDGGKTGKTGGGTGGKEEKTDGNSGHYVIASRRPPERQPTGMPHARANIITSLLKRGRNIGTTWFSLGLR